ncbi:MFS transporter [Streptomyces sp. NBC_00249]|uniref:MFS transporter n=1 Tax=Streptomyces sp. NBC_00249 TaxID=2975690 RepID=UPI002254548E|nr:MFS transporter [Streptomyces sp. NBC_00249]MCX5192453.1 MFS transporter [Streptomyces sp. NBC_00249]
MTYSRPGAAPVRPRRARPSAGSGFRPLWIADAVSQSGSAVTLLALPLVAIGTLDATPFEAGLLVMSEYLAFLLIGLPAGAWVDRLPLRPLMVAGDLGRAVLLLSIPVAGWLGVLTLPQLYAVGFGMSVCTVFFDVAAQSALPQLVDGERLVQANVRLEATRNITQVGGPGLAGALVGALTAPVALVADALSYTVSALLVARVRPLAKQSGARPVTTLRADIAEGLRFVFGHPALRALTLAAAVSNLCGTVGASMLLVLLAGDLGLSPLLCGAVFTAEAVGGLIGSLLTRRIAAALGQGPAMCASLVVSALLWLLALPFYAADWRFAVAVVLQGLGWTAFMTFKISSVAYRQRLCPEPLMGRMTATFRFVVWGSMPVGALVGGMLGQHLGAGPALWAGALGELLAVVPLLLSPLRTARELPDGGQEPHDAPPPAHP